MGAVGGRVGKGKCSPTLKNLAYASVVLVLGLGHIGAGASRILEFMDRILNLYAVQGRW